MKKNVEIFCSPLCFDEDVLVTSGGTNFIPYLMLFIGKTFLRNCLVKSATYVRG